MLAETPALADGGVDCGDLLFPDDYKKVLVEGEERACVTFEEFKGLVAHWNCGETAMAEVSVLSRKLDFKIKEVDLLKESMKLKDTQISSLEEENKNLFRKWSEENEKRYRAENKVNYSWLGWTTAATFATTSLVLGTILVIK